MQQNSIYNVTDGDDEDLFMDLDDDFGTEVEEDETVIDE